MDRDESQKNRARLFKSGLRKPRVSVKFNCRSESFKRKLSLIPHVCNLMIECFGKKQENHPKTAFEQRNIETWIKIEPWVSADRCLNTWAQNVIYLMVLCIQ